MRTTFKPQPLQRPLVVEITTVEELTAHQEGTRLYLRNLKAAQGTAKGLGDSTTQERWEHLAEYIETTVMPKVQEQQDLQLTPIEQAAATRVSEKDRAAGERDDDDEPWDTGKPAYLPPEGKQDRAVAKIAGDTIAPIDDDSDVGRRRRTRRGRGRS